MKKVVSMFISLCLLITCSINVFATSSGDAFPYTISLSDETPAAGETFTIKIALKDYSSLTDKIRGIQVDATNVDTSVFEIVDHKTLIDETGVASNKTSYSAANKRIRLVYANSSGTLNDDVTDIMQIKLKVNESITADGTITLPVKFKIQAVSGAITEESSIVINYKLEADVMSVDIDWGTMEFEYVNGAWNTETHKYGAGKWTCSKDSNKISITNNSTENVTAEINYQAESAYSEISGMFTDSNDNSISECDIGADESQNLFLTLSGKPKESMDSQKIGSVTITIL